MDKNVVKEGNCKRSNSTHPDANSGVTNIEIQPSQLHTATKRYKEDGCNHFSIRGYVAEVCEKNKRICWPLSNVGDHEIKEEEIKLPPLQVPEFRWRKCQNCLRKKGAKDTPSGTGVVTNCCNRVCETKTIPSPVIPSPLSCGDPQKLRSGFQESSEVNLVDGMKSSSDISLHVDKKDKAITKDIHKLTGNVAEEKKNMEIWGPTYSLMELDIPNGEKGCDLSSGGTANVTPSKSKVYKLIKGNCEIHQIKRKGDAWINSAKEIFHTEMRGNVFPTTPKVYKLVNGYCEVHQIKRKGNAWINSAKEIFHTEMQRNVFTTTPKVYKLVKGHCEIHQIKRKGDAWINSAKEIFHTEMQGNVFPTTPKVYKLVEGSCELEERL